MRIFFCEVKEESISGGYLHGEVPEKSAEFPENAANVIFGENKKNSNFGEAPVANFEECEASPLENLEKGAKPNSEFSIAWSADAKRHPRPEPSGIGLSRESLFIYLHIKSA